MDLLGERVEPSSMALPHEEGKFVVGSALADCPLDEFDLLRLKRDSVRRDSVRRGGEFVVHAFSFGRSL